MIQCRCVATASWDLVILLCIPNYVVNAEHCEKTRAKNVFYNFVLVGWHCKYIELESHTTVCQNQLGGHTSNLHNHKIMLRYVQIIMMIWLWYQLFLSAMTVFMKVKWLVKWCVCVCVCGVVCSRHALMIKHPFWDGHYQFHRKSKVSGEQKYVFLKDARMEGIWA